jgi:2-dehydro-3-deoxyphosphogalactonate aldolase
MPLRLQACARCTEPWKASKMPPEVFLHDLPLVAILRGVGPDRILDVGRVLFDAGIRAIEVPLNSPDPFESIARLAVRYGETCLCGAGTVLAAEDVDRVRDAGGKLIVSPNTDSAVIARARRHRMVAMPGFATATEAFAALAAGATHLKLFPAASYGPGHVKALKAVLPKSVPVFAVGGIGADEIAEWSVAGASGFGFGSELYKPEYTLDEIAERARRLVDAVRRVAQK